MKKLVFLLALLVLPLTAAADVSDMLLSSSGSFYTVSSEMPADTDTSNAIAHLVLTEHRGEQMVREIVPATTVRGTHSGAQLGYDSESGTLFVFWIQHFGFLYNQLLFCTRDSAGNWSDATAFGSPYSFPQNLRIAVTRKVIDAADNTAHNALTVHATWWEFDSQLGTESPQYRMLPIQDGRVVDASVLDLTAFVDQTVISPEDAEADDSVLKHPMLSSSAQQDSVLLVYGDIATRTFTKIHITPYRNVAANGRLRVPVGKADGGFRAPRFAVAAESRLEGIFGSERPAAFYAVEGGSLRYVLLNGADGRWSDTRTVTLDEKITASAAADALRRMVVEQ
jgi:hypothetical protein